MRSAVEFIQVLPHTPKCGFWAQTYLKVPMIFDNSKGLQLRPYFKELKLLGRTELQVLFLCIK